MGSRSKRQARFMAMAAHNPEKIRKKDRPPVSVAKEFVEKDQASGLLSKAMKDG